MNSHTDRCLTDLASSRRPSRAGVVSIVAVAVLLGAVLPVLTGCGGAPEVDAQAAAAAPEVPAEIQVPELMAKLGYFTDKVGWSVAARNQKLSVFYLDKLDQVMVQLGAVGRYEGIPLGGMAQATMGSGLGALRSGVEGGDWDTAFETYRGMTLSCNACHAATRREYVVIKPVEGDPPYGQDFSAP